VAPTTPVRNAVADTVAAMKIESPTKKARQEKDDDTPILHEFFEVSVDVPPIVTIMEM